MSIRKYIAYLRTVETGSITQAANELGYTQSAVSKMISDLEQDWQVKLLTRNHSGIEISSDGMVLLPTIREIVKDYEDLNFAVSELHGVQSGTLRLGAYPCHIVPGTKMAECYGTLDISERHRHRYEFNNDYRALMQEKGLVLSGLSPDGHIVETVEIPENDFYIGVQYHPEFKSRPNRAHPLFKGFIAAALKFRIHAQRGMMHV